MSSKALLIHAKIGDIQSNTSVDVPPKLDVLCVRMPVSSTAAPAKLSADGTSRDFAKATPESLQ